MQKNNQNSQQSYTHDINAMHQHYGIHDAVSALTPEQKRQMIRFRFDFLKEELHEGYNAIDNNDPEEVVDSLIDLIVVAIGTLDLYDVDVDKAWNEVLKANMNKKVGIKPSRPNPLGLPDLIKPSGWTGPNHTDNHGTLADILK
jgi:predicted HAD superfamily Cof-like phosphohydrolase